MQELDDLPWYKQFWPWFIIALPAAAVVASLYTVTLAYRSSDSLVVSGEDGVDVIAERHIAAEKRAISLNLEARLNINRETGAVHVTLYGDEVKDWPTALELQFSHPTLAGLDQDVTLNAAIPDADGRPTWSGHLLDVPQGRWYLVLRASDDWRLNASWSGAANVRLLPASAGADSGG